MATSELQPLPAVLGAGHPRWAGPVPLQLTNLLAAQCCIADAPPEAVPHPQVFARRFRPRFSVLAAFRGLPRSDLNFNVFCWQPA